MVYKNVISDIIFVLFCICHKKCDTTVRNRTVLLNRAPGFSICMSCTVVYWNGAWQGILEKW